MLSIVKLLEERLTGSIISAFFEVYNTLGYGFLEHVYILALELELRDRGHDVARQVGVRIMYKGQQLTRQRLDMVIDGKVIVEAKSTLDLHAAARRQLYNYLKATNLEVGLLLHFGPTAKFYREIRSSPKERSAEPVESVESG